MKAAEPPSRPKSESEDEFINDHAEESDEEVSLYPEDSDEFLLPEDDDIPAAKPGIYVPGSFHSILLCSTILCV